jgi:hypothetical protein
MRADLVVAAPPLLRPDLGVDAMTKPLERQELVAECAIERFVGAILLWLPRIDQRRLDAGLVQPPQDRARDELRSVSNTKSYAHT